MVTGVGAPLFVNVAVLSGTVGLELQFVPRVHSAPGPVQVPSTACAAPGVRTASAPRHTLASSAARQNAGRGNAAAIRTATSGITALGTDWSRRAASITCGHNRRERI